MFIHVQALQRESHPGVWTPGRFWSSAELVRVEVLAQDEDPEPDEIDIIENGQKTGTRKVASKAKIGRKTFEELKRDPRIKILNDGETEAVTSAAVLKKAREDHASAVEQLDALRKENADLKEQVQALAEELAAFQVAEGSGSDKGSKGKKSKD